MLYNAGEANHSQKFKYSLKYYFQIPALSTLEFSRKKESADSSLGGIAMSHS